MAFLNSHTAFNLKSESDIFSVPSTQNSIEEGYFQEYRPITPIIERAPIEFLIPGQTMEYLDLSFTTLHLQVMICKIDGTNLDAENIEYRNSQNVLVPAVPGSIVAPINNFMHSLFNNVQVSLNKKCITSTSNLYHYRAYIENLLNYGNEAKKSHLSSIIWEKDMAGNMDVLTERNEGFSKRKKMFSNSKIVDVEGVLHCDLFTQNKHLPNGIELMIKLFRNKDTFCLMSDEDRYKICIKEATLKIRKLKYNPTLMIAHAKTLLQTTAKFPITRVEIKTGTLPRYVQNKTLDNLFLGQLPKRVIVGFVKSDAFNGAVDLNPYNFQNFGLNYINIVTDSYIRADGYRPNFTEDLYISCYNALFNATGILHNNTGNDISRAEYPNGYCLIPFDLTPDISAHEKHWNIQKSGSLGIDLRFAEPLSSTVTVIVFAEFDNLVEIDKDRNIITDYIS
jgi:hypothetical protein